MQKFDASANPLARATISRQAFPDLDWYVTAIPSVAETTKHLSQRFGSEARHVGSYRSERYDSHFCDVRDTKLTAKIDKPQDSSKLPAGLLHDHMAGLDPDLPQVAKIVGLIILNEKELIGIFKERIEGELLPSAIDQGLYTKESLSKELLGLYDAWAARGYILTDQVLSNFVRSSDGKPYLIDQGALFSIRDLDPSYQEFMRKQLIYQIDYAFELRAKGHKLAALELPI